MKTKILILVCALMSIHTEAFDTEESVLSNEVHNRLKRQQQPPFPSFFKESFDKIVQTGSNPLSQFQSGAAEIAKNFPQPLRFKRQQPFQPVFSLFGDHLNRVAKTFESLAGISSSSTTTTTTTTSTTTQRPDKND